jgi:hypothetical protein
MTLPSPAVAALRGMAAASLGATVRLYTPHETHDAGSRPVTVWTPGRPQPGKLIPATGGGMNIQADQATPVGDLVLVLVEGSPVTAGQRATVEGMDRLQTPWQKAVVVKKVLEPRGHEITRRALVTEITGWWPTA